MNLPLLLHQFYCEYGAAFLIPLVISNLLALVLLLFLMGRVAPETRTRLGPFGSFRHSLRLFAYLWTGRFLADGDATYRLVALVNAIASAVLFLAVAGLFIAALHSPDCP